ncbi:MSC_0624 family F1-like ATPase-associated membrane protein [Mycoplasmopsis pulmonis]|uniref:MSC_0624 family F1-like ATPase-associated membrane protein n=1 Tax=Mycoplasmopsis pulmonis TaxID=2107 RepID=UPI002ACEDCCE|nr:hypothetical protein [Mycoplasmopsis pulmonis]MDZ7293487.1 hypothetical protein [Mycoplasmopsis pulmonis]
MQINNTISEKKIYSKHLILENKKLLLKFYKSTILVLFAICFILIFFLYEKTIFNATKDFDIPIFLNFKNLFDKQFNYVIFYKTFILIFVLVYSIKKNYSSVHFQRESIKNYWIWFLLYLSFSISSLALLIFFNPYNKINANSTIDVYASVVQSYFDLIYIFVPLIVLNIAYFLYLNFQNKKTNPIFFKSRWIGILSLISQIILFGLFYTFSYAFLKGPSIPGFLFHENKFYDYLVQIFEVKKTSNLLIMTFASLALLILLVLVNLQNIVFLMSKQFTNEYFKNQISLNMAIYVAVLIWFIRILFIKVDFSIVPGNYNLQWVYLLVQVAVLLALLVINIFLQYWNKKLSSSNLISILYLSFFTSLMWISYYLVTLFIDNPLQKNIHLLSTSLISAINVGFFVFKNKSSENHNMIFILIFLVSSITTLVFAGLQVILLNKQNYAFYAINSQISLDEIFVLVNIAFISLLFLVSFVKTIYIAARFQNKNMKTQSI